MFSFKEAGCYSTRYWETGLWTIRVAPLTIPKWVNARQANMMEPDGHGRAEAVKPFPKIAKLMVDELCGWG